MILSDSWWYEWWYGDVRVGAASRIMVLNIAVWCRVTRGGVRWCLVNHRGGDRCSYEM